METRGHGPQLAISEDDFDDTHLVLCECSSLIGSNHIDGTKSFDDGKFFDENIVASHAFSDDKERHNCAERKSFREVSDHETEADTNDTRPRDEALVSSSEPGDVSDEASEGGDSTKRGDNDDRSADLLLQVGVLFLVISSVDSKGTHHSVVSGRDDESGTRTVNAASSTKSHILRLQVVVARLFVAKSNRLGLSSENRLINFEAVDGEHANVSGDAVTRI